MTKVEKVKGGEESKTFLSCQKDEFESSQGDQTECVVLFRQILRCRREGKEIYFLLLFKGGSAYPSPWMQSLRVRCLCLFGGVEVVVWRRGEVWEVEKRRPERS